MPLGYDYGNARLRAMRSRLLSRADYDRLLASPDVEALLSTLDETPYKADIETALVKVGARQVAQEALGQNLTRTLSQMRGFYQDEPGDLVDLLLRRWDRDNLLTILRGQVQEVSTEKVLAAVAPVGRLDAVALRELARQSGLRAMLDLMTTWQLPYARPLREAQAQAGPTALLEQLELALTRAHYQALDRALGRSNGNRAIVRRHQQIEVDLLNIRTTLRLAHLPGGSTLVQRRYGTGDVGPLLLEFPGCLPVQRLAQLAGEGSGLESVIQGLRDTRYGVALAAGWSRYQADDGSFVMLERELERWHAGLLMTMFRRQPLSIAIPIGYIGAKEVEIANLRLIAQTVALDMERESVAKDLIWAV